MKTPARKAPNRANDGRYAFEGQWERLCTCGHTLGLHAYAAPHDCLNGTGVPGQTAMGDHCDCQRFRLSRKKAVLTQQVTL